MDQQVYAMKIADIFNPEVKKKIISSVNKKIKSIFPSPDTLYQKDIVRNNEVNFTPLQIQNAINANSMQLNTANLTNTNNTKKKSFEEDAHTPVKNKKHSSKFQYREKTISSNNDLLSNYLKTEEENDKAKYDIKIKNTTTNNENDNNSNENTSTCSRDENNSLKVSEVKKEENIYTDCIDILKFNSNKSDKNKKLYSQRESSRFEFVNKNSNSDINDYVNVPDFVSEIIKKKVTRQKFTKNINFGEDIMYKDFNLEKEINSSDQWANYINENKNIDLDKDLIFDFDIINRSIKDKFTTFYLK